MALKLSLKPHEKVIIGGTVITNGAAASQLIIENKVPILRERDILTEAKADTPCRRIYLVIQLMYIDEQRSTELHPLYWELVRDLLQAVPSAKGLIEQASQFILDGNYYGALKVTKKLIEYEKELLRNVSKSG